MNSGKQQYNKPALSYTDQLDRLKRRGLIIEDDVKAIHLLENISYYRLSAYWYPLLETPKSAHVFKAGASFEHAFQLYCFDRELRHLVMNDIEKIEVAVRAKMVYILAHWKGPYWYLDNELFNNERSRQKSVLNLKKEYARSDEDFIRAFKKRYSDDLPPSWMLFEISSFGSLSHFYSNLKPGRTKREIANFFGVDDSTFESWLHTLTYVRNVCAHHSRFWNRRMSIQPKIPRTPSRPFLTIASLSSERSHGKMHRINDRTYFILSMIQFMLERINPSSSFGESLESLFEKYPTVDRSALGYPNGWEKEAIWK